jgi:hypothetical protein
MRMTILTFDDGDGSLSPVVWSHDECHGVAWPSSRSDSSILSLVSTLTRNV